MILVTGGTGFLGSHLLQTLVRSGKEVRCIYRRRILDYVPLETTKYIDWQEADLLDVVSLDRVMDGIDLVYHCAGIVSFDPKDNKAMRAVNIKGTANLVNACIQHRIRKLVHVSSVAALGRNIPGRMIDETSQWEENNHNTEYASTKHEGEIEVWRAAGEGLNTVIVNPSILIGPSPCWEDASAKLIRNSYHGFRWYTRGVNGFVNVTDVTRAMMQLMVSPASGERFILNGDNWSYQEFFAAVHKNLGMTKPLKFAAPWMGELLWRMEKIVSTLSKRSPKITRDMAKTASLKIYYDSGKIKRMLPGFEFTPLDQTIAETCEAFLRFKKTPADPVPTETPVKRISKVQ